MTTRRDFVATVGAALGAATLGRPHRLAALEFREKLGPIGIQLYTVRQLMEQNMDRTLDRIARIGYKEVEFAGYFGRSPDRVRRLLAQNGLTSPSTHIQFPADDDAWKRALDDARIVGHEWATIPWIDEKIRKSADDWKIIAERFNHFATVARSSGMKFAYHNHNFEFDKVGDTNGLEILLSNTDRKLVDFEMDLYWVVKGGGDPVSIFYKHPGRFKLMHAKDATPFPQLAMVDVGAGAIDFKSIFSRKSTSGMQHLFVEHDEPADAMASATNSYKYLSGLSF